MLFIKIRNYIPVRGLNSSLSQSSMGMINSKNIQVNYSQDCLGEARILAAPIKG